MSNVRFTDEVRTKSQFHFRFSIKSLLLAFVALAIGIDVLVTLLQRNRDADLRGIFGGPSGLSVLKYADRVEAYRIGRLADTNSDALNRAAVADFPILTGPVVVEQTEVQALRRTFVDRNSYLWNVAKGCIPAPGVRLDFIHGDERLSVLLCFECDILLNYLDDKRVGGEDFDNVRPTLVRTVRAIFPDDQEIQSLAEQHWGITSRSNSKTDAPNH